MANPIDIVISKEALAEIDKAISKVGALDKEIQSTAQSFISNSKKMASALSSITPVDVSESIADNSKLTAELDRQSKVIQGLETQIKKLSQVRAETIKRVDEERLAEIKLQQDREKAFDKFEKQLALEGKAREKAIEMAKKQQLAEEKQAFARREAFDKNTKKLEAQAVKELSTYNRIQTSVNSLTKTYNDLAIRKELGNTLSKNEEKQLVYLTNRIKTYQDALLKVDSTIGKHQRNVGNYASGYNALGNSINQLSREAPAFANSINTGFMAISNNIPALTDAIRGIRAENKALAAEGKPTVSVLKQLAGAIFSWQTLISVGVTLLTLYGGKLIDLAFGATKAEKAQQALNEEMKNAKNSISSEATQLQSLTNIVLDHNESSVNRKLAYDEIKKTLPGLTSATYEQAISTGELTRATNLYISSLVQKNIVEAEAKSIAEQQTELNKETSKSYKEQIGTVEAFLQSLQPERQRKNIEKSMKAQIKAEQDAQQQIIDNRKKALVKAQEDYLKTQSQLKPFVTAPEKTKGTRAERAKKEAIELKSVADTISQINAKIAELQQKAIVGEGKSLLGMTNKEIADYKEKNAVVIEQAKEDLSDLIKLKTQLNALPTASTTILQPVKKEDVDNLKQLSQEMKDYLSNFTSDFINQSGFTNTFKILADEIDGFGENASVTFNAIAESAQEMFNFISNASQANFDAEYARLESQKENSLKFAGEGTEARKKIEEDYEKKKKEIANRENKAKQKQAIFNIAIDTAQAIVGLWAKPGFPKAIPLAIAVGALGAAQIGMVASQKIPQYFDGGVHGGGLAMINDAGGSNYVETVVTPDGKVQQFKGRDVVTDLPKGTEIFTPEQWQQKELEYMLNSRGVMLNNQVNKGMTAEQMDAILAKHFGKIQTNTTVFDKKGIMQWTESRGTKTIRNANRATGRGFSV